MNKFARLGGRAPLLAAAAIAAVCASYGAEPAGASGTLTDKRDGRVYETVKVGAKTWMAENINIETGSSWCYECR